MRSTFVFLTSLCFVQVCCILGFFIIIESTLQKLDAVRQEVRNADRKKREVAAQVEECTAEANKERKLRARSDQVQVLTLESFSKPRF